MFLSVQQRAVPDLLHRDDIAMFLFCLVQHCLVFGEKTAGNVERHDPYVGMSRWTMWVWLVSSSVSIRA